MTRKERFQAMMEEEILTLLAEQDEYTQSDLQARVSAIVMQCMAYHD